MVELNRTLPELLMRRDGTVTVDGVPQPLLVEKRFVFRPRSIDVYYRLTSNGPADLSATFGVEINVSLAARSAENGRLFLLDEDRKTEISSDAAEMDGVQGLLVHDVRNEVSVTLSSVRAFRCWSVPLETLSGGDQGGHREFQSHCFVPLWDVQLAPGGTWENHLSVGFEKTQTASRRGTPRHARRGTPRHLRDAVLRVIARRGTPRHRDADVRLLRAARSRRRSTARPAGSRSPRAERNSISASRGLPWK